MTDNLFAAISLSARDNTQIKNTVDNMISANYRSVSCHVVDSTSHFVYLATYTEKFTGDVVNENCPPECSLPIISQSRLDNANDLLERILSVKKFDAAQILSNNRLIIESYYLFKEKMCAELCGNFSFILWDDESKRVLAGIDAFSTRSLHYMVVDDVLYIASDAKILSRLPNVSLTVNKKAVSQWLAGRPDPNLSMYNEISLVPLGCYLSWQNNTFTIEKFWDINPNSKLRYSTTQEYKDHFFDVLGRSVSNRLKNEFDGSSVFCQMSGGMDSTSITALATIDAQKTGVNLHTLSHSYKNTESCNEMANINDMISKLNIEHAHFIELDKFNDISFGELYPTDFDNPGVVLSPKYHEELALMQQLGASTLLTGNGGDEVCWGHSASYRSRLYKGELGVINEVVKACGELGEPVAKSLISLFVKPLVPRSFSNLVKFAMNKPLTSKTDTEMPAWLFDEAKALLIDTTEVGTLSLASSSSSSSSSSEFSITNPFSKTFEPAKYARYHSLNTTSTYNSMRSYQKVANGYGIDVRHPFFDTKVVEFSFAIPEKMLIQGSYPKWLLRHTMQDYLPESVVWNKHKTVFDHHFANLIRSNHEEIRGLLSHTGLHDLGLLNNEVLLRAFDEIVNDVNKHLNVDMLYAILTQSWYQTHCLE